MMRVSLARAVPPAPRAPPLLAPDGAAVVLGGAPASGVAPIAASACTLFGPRGVCLAGDEGPLFVADTGHHRVLRWDRVPDRDDTPADGVIGQPGFAGDRRNGGGAPGPATCNMPTGIVSDGTALVVADAWNHRVLVWRRLPDRSNAPADVVLGQPDFVSTLPNRGREVPGADTLNACAGVALHEGRLYVADTANRRVLVWHALPMDHGAPADLVLGQRDFMTRDEGAAGAVGPVGMRWPHGIARAGAALLVVDAGLSRVMVWRREPSRHGAPCDAVWGHVDATSGAANRGAFAPDETTLNLPYALAVHGSRVLVADTANSRLVGFDAETLADGAPALALAGQPTFTERGENRWGAATRESLCWPYGICARGGRVAIADSGNNRVLLWPTA